MPRILCVTTARADQIPLWPVICELRAVGFDVHVASCGAVDLVQSAKRVQNAFNIGPFAAVVWLGDRWELLPVCTEAMLRNITIVHLHGGELTAGAFDDKTRCAVSMLSNVHLVAHPSYAQRVRSFGCSPVCVVGAPGLDNLHSLPARDMEEVKRLRQCVATWHPVTRAAWEHPRNIIAELEARNINAIWTSPNTDPGYREVKDMIGHHNFSYLDPSQFVRECRKSLFVIGNSSMGVIEAPTMRVPTVNVGKRQEGRICGSSVISCPYDEVGWAIDMALEYEGPFEDKFGRPGEVATKIVMEMRRIFGWM